jgi:hypothetical protein
VSALSAIHPSSALRSSGKSGFCMSNGCRSGWLSSSTRRSAGGAGHSARRERSHFTRCLRNVVIAHPYRALGSWRRRFEPVAKPPDSPRVIHDAVRRSSRLRRRYFNSGQVDYSRPLLETASSVRSRRLHSRNRQTLMRNRTGGDASRRVRLDWSRCTLLRRSWRFFHKRGRPARVARSQGNDAPWPAPQQEVCVVQRLKQPPFVIMTFPPSANDASGDDPPNH